MSMLKSALKYHSLLHYSVFPVSKDKKPLIKWETYQKRLPTEEEIKTWWTKWPQANIGIATGLISGIAVIDLDDVQTAKDALQPLISDSLLFPIAKTPSGGEHWYFACVDGNIKNNSRVVPGADLRANGGYVVAPPSTNGNGRGWRWQDGLRPDLIALPYLPKEYLSFIASFDAGNADLSMSFQQEASTNYPQVSSNCPQKSVLSIDVHKMFVEGRRDEDLFHIANCLVKGGAKESEILQTLEILAKNCNPPFPEREMRAKIQSALNRSKKHERALSQEIEDWIRLQSGYITSTDIYNCLQLSTRAEKKNVSIILQRLAKKGVIEKYGNKAGQFRVIEAGIDKMDFVNVQTNTLDLKWPFQIEDYVLTLPKSIIVIAGVSNAGKTAMLLNFIEMNMQNFDIHYFSSELSGRELNLRLSKFERPISSWNFAAYERGSNFADVIKPNSINIIDFVEIYEEHYKIGLHIKEIFDKLENGIAIIALQKKPGNPYGVGGMSSLEKARLYLAIDAGRIKIEKGKNWAQENVNPNGLICNFKLVQGCKFIKTTEWYKKEEL